MLSILVNAYAVNPNWGSEPGMGWNWIVNLACHSRLFVITEGEWRKEIEEAVETLPQKDNLQFYYNPLPEKVRKMCWNQGDWRFYWYYRKWQKETLKIAQNIIANNHIDVVHQLNMIGFREPGYLWKIKDIPFVWGPIGGMGTTQVAYYKDVPLKLKLFCRIKNIINELQSKYHPRVRSAIYRSDALISAVKDVQDVIRKYYDKQSVLINETGTSIEDVPVRNASVGTTNFNLMWVGKFDFRKQLGLAIKSVAATGLKDITLHICGEGNAQQTSTYKHLADDLGVSSQCKWYGKVEHHKIQKMMSESDIFFFTSIADATSTVVLEAVSSGLPILSFNTCGFGPIVNDFAGETIELSSPEKSVCDFAEKIKRFYYHREELDRISKIELQRRADLTWESKAKQVTELYKKVIGSKGQVS